MEAQAKGSLHAKVAFWATFFVGQEKAKPAAKRGRKTTGLSGAISYGPTGESRVALVIGDCGFLFFRFSNHASHFKAGNLIRIFHERGNDSITTRYLSVIFFENDFLASNENAKQ